MEGQAVAPGLESVAALWGATEVMEVMEVEASSAAGEGERAEMVEMRSAMM